MHKLFFVHIRCCFCQFVNYESNYFTFLPFKKKHRIESFTNSIFLCVKRSMPNVLPFIFPAFSHMWFVQMTHCHIFQLSKQMCCVVWTLTHSLVRWAWYTDSCVYWVKNMKMCWVITLLLKQIQAEKVLQINECFRTWRNEKNGKNSIAYSYHVKTFWDVFSFDSV